MITHVAVMRGGTIYSLPSPNRHHHLFPIMPERDDDSADVQGFLNGLGEFLTREEAFVVAKENGQLKRRNEPGDYEGTLLFSEDLW